MLDPFGHQCVDHRVWPSPRDDSDSLTAPQPPQKPRDSKDSWTQHASDSGSKQACCMSSCFSACSGRKFGRQSMLIKTESFVRLLRFLVGSWHKCGQPVTKECLLWQDRPVARQTSKHKSSFKGTETLEVAPLALLCERSAWCQVCRRSLR